MHRIYIYIYIYNFFLFLPTCMFPACCFCQRTYLAQNIINRLHNDTLTRLCLQFEWCSVGYGFVRRSLLSFSQSMFTLACITTHWSLIFDVFVYICMCVGVVFGFHLQFFFRWVCASVKYKIKNQTNIQIINLAIHMLNYDQINLLRLSLKIWPTTKSSIGEFKKKKISRIWNKI